VIERHVCIKLPATKLPAIPLRLQGEESDLKKKKDPLEAEGRFYEFISPIGCVGPITAAKMRRWIDGAIDGYAYWPCRYEGDEDECGDHLRLRIGPDALSEVRLSSKSMHREQTSLYMLKAVEEYVWWWSSAHKLFLNESITDFDWICTLAESMDSTASTALNLTPEFRDIPGCEQLLNYCGRVLYSQLQSLASEATVEDWFDHFQMHKLEVAIGRMRIAAEAQEDE
jgi:hypothetical protein